MDYIKDSTSMNRKDFILIIQCLETVDLWTDHILFVIDFFVYQTETNSRLANYSISKFFFRCLSN